MINDYSGNGKKTKKVKLSVCSNLSVYNVLIHRFLVLDYVVVPSCMKKSHSFLLEKVRSIQDYFKITSFILKIFKMLLQSNGFKNKISG